MIEKQMKISFRIKDNLLEIWNKEKNDTLIYMKISGIDRDKLADVVSDVLRINFFVWCKDF